MIKYRYHFWIPTLCIMKTSSEVLPFRNNKRGVQNFSHTSPLSLSFRTFWRKELVGLYFELFQFQLKTPSSRAWYEHSWSKFLLDAIRCANSVMGFLELKLKARHTRKLGPDCSILIFNWLLSKVIVSTSLPPRGEHTPDTEDIGIFIHSLYPKKDRCSRSASFFANM